MFQCRPGPDVQPFAAQFDHKHAGGIFHHRIVDTDFLKRRVRLSQHRRDVLALGCGLADGAKFAQRVRQQVREVLADRPQSPDEHSAVPEVMPALDVLASDAMLGFLLECVHFTKAFFHRGLALNVAQPNVRPGRPDAEGYQRVGVSLRRVAGIVDGLGEVLLRADDMVGCENRDCRLLVTGADKFGRQGHGVGGIPSNGLADDILAFDARQLPANLIGVLGVGDDPDVRRIEDSLEPLHRQLEQALAPDQRQKLLGPGHPAQRPESLAGSAGHDYGISHDHCLLCSPAISTISRLRLA